MIIYTLEYSKRYKLYNVWKNSFNHGLAFHSLFKGSKQKCLEYIKKNNIKIGKI